MILFTIECRVDSSVPHDLAALPIVSQPPRVSLHALISIWKSLYIDFHKTEATRRVQWPTRRVRHLKPVHGKSARPESRNFWPTRRVDGLLAEYVWNQHFLKTRKSSEIVSTFQNILNLVNRSYGSWDMAKTLKGGQAIQQHPSFYKIQDPSFKSLVPLLFPSEHVFVTENEIFKLIKHLLFIKWDKNNIKY